MVDELKHHKEKAWEKQQETRNCNTLRRSATKPHSPAWAQRPSRQHAQGNRQRQHNSREMLAGMPQPVQNRSSLVGQDTFPCHGSPPLQARSRDHSLIHSSPLPWDREMAHTCHSTQVWGLTKEFLACEVGKCHCTWLDLHKWGCLWIKIEISKIRVSHA